MTMGSTKPTSPDVRRLVAPLLPSLPGAAIATQPATALLPLLSPILRQRVQLLSSASTEPWVRLLSYDTAKAARLAELARSDRFEPHPVSGEVEIDWEHDVETKYRRLDSETLQALVILPPFDLFVRLVYCTGDNEGGGDGWRIGEVSVADRPSPFASFGGKTTIEEAETEFKDQQSHLGVPRENGSRTNDSDEKGHVLTSHGTGGGHSEEEEDDDDYWARYTSTPARTPAKKRSPAPASAQTSHLNIRELVDFPEDEDAYFAQYGSVQPAMDNHDPDEAVHIEGADSGETPPRLGLARPSVPNNNTHRTTEDAELNETNGVWTLAGGAETSSSSQAAADEDEEERQRRERILHPRPALSDAGSSSGSSMVAKLEESAERREQGEFGVRQHVSRSIKSLFLLARTSGIDRDEFERMVKTELDLLGMIED